ncbi:MAG: branched-chain amino acid ABC transporter permease, partial [Clostridia bacterium]
MIFLNQLINGLHVGSIYALIALGYTMVYGIVKLINFAHGDIIMVGAYVVLLSLTVLKLPIWLAALVGMAVCALFGVVIERVAYKPLRSAPRISALITAIGVSLLLENAFMLLMSANPRPFPAVFSSQPIQIGSLRIAIVTLVTIGVVLLLCTLLQLFIKKTKMGKAMRAVSEDMGAARLMGINVNVTISLTFAIGSALA